MVSGLSMFCMFIALLLSFALPIVVLLLLTRGRKGVFGVWLVGALGFIIPQLVIRIPLLQAFGTQPGFQEFSKGSPYLYIFLLALTAALFETTGRFVVLKMALSKRLSYMTGVVSGAGHGGIEAITLVGFLYINNLVISFFINAGNISMIIPDPAVAESVRQSLMNASPDLFLMAGFERVFTMMFHIALSILFTLFIMKKRTALGFVLVASLHFAVDFFIVLLQLKGTSPIILEILLFAIAIASLILAIKIRPSFGESLSIPVDLGEQAVKEGY